MPSHPPLDDQQTAAAIKKWPALTSKIAVRMLKRAGITEVGPEQALAMTQTDEFKQKASEFINEGGQNRALQGFLQDEPELPSLDLPIEQQETQLFDIRERETLGQIRHQGIIASRIAEATFKANRLADFDEIAHKTARLKEMNPTEDIDKQIMQLRFREFKEIADIRSNPRFSHLSPQDKEEIISNKRQEARDTSNELKDLRNSRLQAAEGRVDQEISSRNAQISRAKNVVDDFKAMEDELEKTGENREALFKLRDMRQKHQREIDKARGKGGATEEEMLTESILNEFRDAGFGTPDGTDEKSAKAEAKRIAKKLQEINEQVKKGEIGIKSGGKEAMMREFIEKAAQKMVSNSQKFTQLESLDKLQDINEKKKRWFR